MNVTHYDLFAGIGGFSYALDTIFKEHEINHIFCEWEAFPTAVLKKHWPDATYYGDIADLVADTRRAGLEEAGSEQQAAGSGRGNITMLTGGFPCQPFSHAGRRQGTADDRYQWPNMFEVIRNVRPDWIIAENVRGLATWNEGMVLETVCADLESEGYEVQPLIIPAVAIGAPHKRDRVWIVANRHSRQKHTEHQRPSRLSEQQGSALEAGPETPRPADRQSSDNYNGGRTWSADWREVALTTCHDGVDDGLPRWMDGATISAAKHRQERLKACGNAIVPQVAMEIFSAIIAQYE